MKLALLAPVLSARDAVGSDVLAMAAALRARGVDVRLYADHATGIDDAVHTPHGLPAWLSGADDVLVYHYSIGWPRAADLLARVRGRRYIRYHNVTPPGFFTGWSADHVRACAAGRAALPVLLADAQAHWWPCSTYSADELVAHGLPRERCSVLPPLHRVEALAETAADPDRIDRWAGACNWLSVGRIAPNKGHLLLLDAFAGYVRDVEPDARLLLAGKRDRRLHRYSRMLEARCAALGITEHVHFLDSVDEATLKAAYVVADALVVTSEHEGFCVPPVEAMALGVPVVARAATALPSTVGDAGLLWDEPDPRLYAASVARLRRDPAARRMLTDAGERRFRDVYRRSVLEAQLAALLGLAA